MINGINKMNDMSFAHWLKTEMTDRRLTQSELSRMAGVNQGLISQVINERRAPTFSFCYHISKALDKNPETLFEMAGLSKAVASEAA